MKRILTLLLAAGLIVANNGLEGAATPAPSNKRTREIFEGGALGLVTSDATARPRQIARSTARSPQAQAAMLDQYAATVGLREDLRRPVAAIAPAPALLLLADRTDADAFREFADEAAHMAARGIARAYVAGYTAATRLSPHVVAGWNSLKDLSAGVVARFKRAK